ncbi:unnamed protein product [Spirodela intermedia]|uniref:VWFA domain-containing protein n=1 Tax=Spirodela intermedia TaxID=51605 RepID=A0A7I8JVM2_SPIIN|nr:unnamed protein product [Spirodela intermedia]CAA6673502.1 unnamed protein product [Spirodela intermedia]
MVLESTMICIDNSEWMRNGDYSPSRFQAQADAVNLICGAKTQVTGEEHVGILTMAGKGVRVLVTPTTDLGKIWVACTVKFHPIFRGYYFLCSLFHFSGLEIGGEMNITAGIQVAQLALKHRQNKKQQQRIIVFAGSPVTYDKKALEAIGRKLKKNSVALDVVDFGDEEDGKAEKLDALIASVNNNESSHIVHVPAGTDALSDHTNFHWDGEGGSGFTAAAAAAGGMSGFDFGVDPNLDPELALALRISMEEERARQEAAAKKATEDASKQETDGKQASSSRDVGMAEAVSSSHNDLDKKDDQMDDETSLLQQAVAMSMDKLAPVPSSSMVIADADMSDAVDQDLALALQMSIEDSAKDSSTDTEVNKVLGDQSLMSSILASLPGVNPDDPSVKELLGSLQRQSELLQPQDKENEDESGKKEEKQ